MEALDALRARIRELEGTQDVQRVRVPSGLEAVDALIGGLPRPGLVELTGPDGSGRTRLAAAMAARHVPVAWIDPDGRVFPPALAAIGLDLSRTLWVRPASDRRSWAVEQVVRSGCFALVVVSDDGVLGRAGQRWSLAAETGACTVVVVRRVVERGLPAEVRLGVRDGEVVVLRNRGSRVGMTAPIADFGERVEPW